jgi:hypothetical protein
MVTAAETSDEIDVKASARTATDAILVNIKNPRQLVIVY